mmetsp:Transcript_99/g.263  ORF Transcript_99/g.263 Transcript_99/m.263 type:complete len:476 (-) Transcript_99:556-1983(-)
MLTLLTMFEDGGRTWRYSAANGRSGRALATFWAATAAVLSRKHRWRRVRTFELVLIRAAHGVQEGKGVLGLLSLLGPAPPKELAHEVDDVRQHIDRRLGVHVGQACSACENIHGRQRILVLDGEHHLRLEKGVLGHEAARVQVLVASGVAVANHLRDLQSPRAVVAGEVLGDISVIAVVFTKSDGNDVELLLAHNPGAVRTNQLEPGSDARARPELEVGVHVKQLVYGVLRHLAVGGPLAAADGDHVARVDFDDMLARNGLGVVTVDVLDQGPDARPGRADVVAGDAPVEVAAALPEHKVNLVRAGLGEHRDRGSRVGGAAERAAFPREEEEHAAIGSVWHNEAHLRRAKVVGEDNVDPARRDDEVIVIVGAAVILAILGLRHAAQGVAKRARGVDDGLGPHDKLLPAAHVAHLGALDISCVRVLDELLHIDIVCHGSAGLGGSEHDQQGVAGVVHLAVIVHECAGELVGVEHRE